jgi:hypothetical protein
MLAMNALLPGSFFLLCLSLPAQCGLSIAASGAYGNGCSEVFPQGPELEVTLDPVSCVLDLDVAADNGCCNVFLQGTMLAIGFQPAVLPLPFLDPSCVLFVQPDAVFAQLGAGATTFSFALPPTAPPFTFYAQGVALYYTTTTFPLPYSFDVALTPGHLVALQ